MSKIGKRPIELPSTVEATIEGQRIRVRGPKGELERILPKEVTVALTGSQLVIRVAHPEEKFERSLWGLSRSLIANMVSGVLTPYERKLEIQGIGYRAASSGSTLTLEIGYSHPVVFPLPKGIECVIEKNIVTLRGIDKALLGQTAARIRALRKPEPYKGKGIRFVGEVVRKKAGKAAKAAGSKTV